MYVFLVTPLIMAGGPKFDSNDFSNITHLSFFSDTVTLTLNRKPRSLYSASADYAAWHSVDIAIN